MLLSPLASMPSASILLKSIANRCASQNALSMGCSEWRCGPSQQLGRAIQPVPASGAPMGVGARWSTSIAPPVLVMDAGTGRPGGTETVNVWSMPAGGRAPAFRVTSIQTTLLSETASSVACFACPASGDMDAFSASPERACNASPPAVSRTPTVVTVTGTGNPLVSSSS